MLFKTQRIKNLLMSFLIKLMIRHRMKRIQSKLHRTGTYVFVKFICLVLMMKDEF